MQSKIKVIKRGQASEPKPSKDQTKKPLAVSDLRDGWLAETLASIADRKRREIQAFASV